MKYLFKENSIYSFFRLDANSSKLKVGGWSMFLLLNVFHALEGTFKVKLSVALKRFQHNIFLKCIIYLAIGLSWKNEHFL